MTEAFLAGLTGNDWPRLESSRIASADATLVVVAHPDLTWFRGHFPGHPVLPGIVQVQWAAQWGRGLFHIEGEFAGIDNLKFQRIVTPGVTLTVALEYSVDRGRLAFEYADTAGRCSTGRIRFTG